MGNYYEILGIEYAATATQIRAAYKRKAMRYHPDHNPGSPEAEELFKMVNEAYHTLSDAVKKARYVRTQCHVCQSGRLSARNTQMSFSMARMQQQPYRIDKEYVRIQPSLSWVTVIAGSLSLIHLRNLFGATAKRRSWQQHEH